MGSSVATSNHPGFLPKGLTPSVEGRPSVSRRWATEACPKSGRASNALPDISRTSPQSSGQPRTARSLPALGIGLHGSVCRPEAPASAQARSYLHLSPSSTRAIRKALENPSIFYPHQIACQLGIVARQSAAFLPLIACPFPTVDLYCLCACLYSIACLRRSPCISTGCRESSTIPQSIDACARESTPKGDGF